MGPSALRSTILAICLMLGVPMVIYVGLLRAMVAAHSAHAVCPPSSLFPRHQRHHGEWVAARSRAHFTGLIVTATYRIGGVIPVLSPVSKVPLLFAFFTRRLPSTWDNMRRLGEFVQGAERYHVTLLHRRGRHRQPEGAFEEQTESRGQSGTVTIWPTPKGEIRLELLKYGVHDKIISFPVTGLAKKLAAEGM
ncbi:hypothetical protein B0H67DRAFT_555903 [Lasiosphaeris hirsuta]|uniref:Uncharacterized protein n=1 Tax=Lasiosphaeris hirsuta TaxID=260670 RepID=A0AA40DU80_9PEZI|nr:hypothetical protein B0H67DRAFT_555903 [Lasiosphaeris hirsuta]